MANDKANVHSDTFNCRWESFHVIYDAIVSCIVDFLVQFGKHGVSSHEKYFLIIFKIYFRESLESLQK